MQIYRGTILFTLVTTALCAGGKDVIVTGADGYMNVRSGPGKQNQIVDKIYQGSKSHYIKTASNDNWYLIETPNGVSGYVNTAGVAVIESGVPAQSAYPPPPPRMPDIDMSRPPALGFSARQVLQAGNDVDAAEQFQNNTGRDYKDTLESAMSNNANALQELLTPMFFDGAGFEGHSTLVFRLMHHIGDTRFAIGISRLNKAQKNNVAKWLSNEMQTISNGVDWRDYLKMHFNETANRLGLYNQ